jgi:hypothetical protein
MDSLKLRKMLTEHNLKVHLLQSYGLCQTLSYHLLNSHACIFLGEVLSELISSVEESGAKYAVLYVSDLSRSIQYPSYRELQRFLAESATGNGSTNSTACDGVCQLKSSLLEGLFVVSFFSHFYKYSELTTLKFLSICLASFMNMLIWQEQNFLLNEIYYSYNYTTFFLFF